MTPPLPLPATPEAIGMGCKCLIPGMSRLFYEVAVLNVDCPLHSESARAARDEDRAQPFRGRPVL